MSFALLKFYQFHPDKFRDRLGIKEHGRVLYSGTTKEPR